MALKPKRRDALLLLSLLLIIILLKLPSIFEPHWYSDEGFYSAAANALQYGDKLYKDIYTTQNPGIFYIFYITNLSHTLSLVLIKVLNLLIIIGSAFFLYKISKKLFSRKIGYSAVLISILFFGLPIIDTNIVSVENIFSLFSLAGIYFALKDETKSIIISGILFGISFFISFKTIFDLIALLFFLFIKKQKLSSLKSFIFLLFGLSIPLILFLAFLTSNNIFDVYSQIVINHNFNEIVNLEALPNGFLFIDNSLINRSIFMIFMLLLTIHLYSKKKISSKSAYLFIWAILSCYSVLLYQKPYLHYFIQAVPVFCLLASLLIRKIKNETDYLIRIYDIAIFVLSISFIFNLFSDGYAINSNINCLKYYLNFSKYLTHQIDTTSYVQFFGNQTYETYRLRNYLAQNFSEENNIYIWTDNPWIYKLADINSPTRYLRNFEAERNFDITKQDLSLSNPDLIIINENTQPSASIESYIFDNNYEFYREFENYKIYIKGGKNIADN